MKTPDSDDLIEQILGMSEAQKELIIDRARDIFLRRIDHEKSKQLCVDMYTALVKTGEMRRVDIVYALCQLMAHVIADKDHNPDSEPNDTQRMMVNVVASLLPDMVLAHCQGDTETVGVEEAQAEHGEAHKKAN